MLETIITAFVTTIITGVLAGLIKLFINRHKKFNIVVERFFINKKQIKLVLCIYNNSTQPQFYSNVKIGVGENYKNLKMFLAETSSPERKTPYGELQSYLVEAEAISPKNIKRIKVACYGDIENNSHLWIVYTNNRGKQKYVKLSNNNLYADGVKREKIDF